MRAKWRFSSILRVPWRPVLAAGGSTTHKFDPDTGLVRSSPKWTRHLASANADAVCDSALLQTERGNDGDADSWCWNSRGRLGPGQLRQASAVVHLRVVLDNRAMNGLYSERTRNRAVTNCARDDAGGRAHRGVGHGAAAGQPSVHYLKSSEHAISGARHLCDSIRRVTT